MSRGIDWDNVNRQKRLWKQYAACAGTEQIKHQKILKPKFPMTDEQQKWYEQALQKLRKKENDG